MERVQGDEDRWNRDSKGEKRISESPGMGEKLGRAPLPTKDKTSSLW